MFAERAVLGRSRGRADRAERTGAADRISRKHRWGAPFRAPDAGLKGPRHMHMMCGATYHHVGFPNDRQLEPDCPLASEDRRGPMRRVTVDRNAAGPFSTVHQATALRIT